MLNSLLLTFSWWRLYWAQWSTSSSSTFRAGIDTLVDSNQRNGKERNIMVSIQKYRDVTSTRIHPYHHQEKANKTNSILYTQRFPLLTKNKKLNLECITPVHLWRDEPNKKKVKEKDILFYRSIFFFALWCTCRLTKHPNEILEDPPCSLDFHSSDTISMKTDKQATVWMDNCRQHYEATIGYNFFILLLFLLFCYYHPVVMKRGGRQWIGTPAIRWQWTNVCCYNRIVLFELISGECLVVTVVFWGGVSTLHATCRAHTYNYHAQKKIK